MVTMSLVWLSIAAIILYSGGTLFRFLGPDSLTSSRKKNMMMTAGLLAAVLHGIVVFESLLTPNGINLSFFTVAALIGFMLVTLTWLISLYAPLENLFVMIFPLSALSLVGLTIKPLTAWNMSQEMIALWPHIFLSLLAYTVLAACCCQAVLMLIGERQLRERRWLNFIPMLPPLTVMDGLLFRLLWAGFMLLSIAILTGFIFLENIFQQRVVHHTVLSLSSWCIFAVLLWGRTARGWRGRIAARWTIIGFGLLLLAYFGSKLVIEIILANDGSSSWTP